MTVVLEAIQKGKDKGKEDPLVEVRFFQKSLPSSGKKVSFSSVVAMLTDLGIGAPPLDTDPQLLLQRVGYELQDLGYRRCGLEIPQVVAERLLKARSFIPASIAAMAQIQSKGRNRHMSEGTATPTASSNRIDSPTMENKVIKVLVSENPKKANSNSGRNFEKYFGNPTVKAFRADGGIAGYIRHDARLGYVELLNEDGTHCDIFDEEIEAFKAKRGTKAPRKVNTDNAAKRLEKVNKNLEKNRKVAEKTAERAKKASDRVTRLEAEAAELQKALGSENVPVDNDQNGSEE